VRSVTLERGPERPISVIIPARSLQELRRASGEAEKPIEMLIAPNRNQVFFHTTSGQYDIDLVSQLVEGTFPDYKQIIPTTYNTKITVNTPDLLKAVKMAFIFARDSANIVRMQVVPAGNMGPGRIIVTATSAEHGDNVSELDATVEGGPLEIAFNARYLIDVLSVIDTAQVAVETRDPQAPGVIRSVGGGDFVHVIMPMHVAR